MVGNEVADFCYNELWMNSFHHWFRQNSKPIFNGCWTDSGSRNLIRQQLSQLADDNAGLLPLNSFSWILCKLTTFGAEETDTLRIYQAFLSQLNQFRQFCRILAGDGAHCKFDSPAAVANRITIGLGLSTNKRAASPASCRALAALLSTNGSQLLCGDRLQNHRHPAARVA